MSSMRIVDDFDGEREELDRRLVGNHRDVETEHILCIDTGWRVVAPKEQLPRQRWRPRSGRRRRQGPSQSPRQPFAFALDNCASVVAIGCAMLWFWIEGQA